MSPIFAAHCTFHDVTGMALTMVFVNDTIRRKFGQSLKWLQSVKRKQSTTVRPAKDPIDDNALLVAGEFVEYHS